VCLLNSGNSLTAKYLHRNFIFRNFATNIINKTDKVMKAAFLIRCSTTQQDYDRQIDDLTKVANSYKFETSPDLIFGEYITGKDDTTKKDRKSIELMKEAAKAHKFDVLLVNEVSRMSRDSVSGRVYVRELNNFGIPTYFRDKGKWTINLETREVDEAFEKELGLYFDGAAEYLKSMKTFTASGRRNRLRDNQMIQGKIYGYKKLGGKDKYNRNTLIVNEEEATIIRYAYNTYIEEGSTIKSTALAISAKFGFDCSIGKVYHILKNTSYHTGYTTVTTIDPDTKKEEVFKITFDTIIDEELYNKATKKLVGNRASKVMRSNKQKKYLLSRLVKCSFCGASYTPSLKSTGYVNWRCHSRINNSHPDCKCEINLNDDKLSTVVWELIKKELLPLTTYNKEEKERRTAEEKKLIDKLNEDITLLSKELKNVDKTLERAYTAYISAPESAAKLALDMYNKTLTEATSKKDSINKDIETKKLHIQYAENRIDRYNRVDFTTDYLKELETDNSKKRQVFEEYIDAIYPYKAGYRLAVLEVHTTTGDCYYILLDSGQRKHQIATYIRYEFAVWQNSNNRYKAIESGDYFYCPNASNIMETEDLEEYLSFREIEKVCNLNNWILDYSGYPNNPNKNLISNIEKYNAIKNKEKIV